MKTRILSGFAAATFAVVLFLYGPMWGLMLTALSCAAVAYLEYDKLFFTPSKPRIARLLTTIALSIFAMHVSATAAWLSFWFAISFFMVSHVLSGNKLKQDLPHEVRDVSLELMGYWYVVSIFGFLVPIAELPANGRHYLILLFVLVFLNDTAAYFVGRFFGRHTLAKQLSPKKTVEGAIGGLVASVVGAYCWLRLMGPVQYESSYLVRLLLAAPVVAGLAQFGDLFESMLKRSQQQKDSGTFLPGHGGMLDRVDGLALSAPAFYFYVVYVLESL